MNFQGFMPSDFETFTIDGLSARMEAIQERIQPKFRAVGEMLAHDLSVLLGTEMFLHIARHARRTVNPPKDTWLAICNNKRGYKQHPHFQVGLYDDHLFIWLAFIYELPNKRNIASTFLEYQEEIRKQLPDDFVISMDHMKKDKQRLDAIDLNQALTRFRDVKKAELLLGRHVAADDPLVRNGQALYELIIKTFETLVPVYWLAYR